MQDVKPFPSTPPIGTFQERQQMTHTQDSDPFMQSDAFEKMVQTFNTDTYITDEERRHSGTASRPSTRAASSHSHRRRSEVRTQRRAKTSLETTSLTSILSPHVRRKPKRALTREQIHDRATLIDCDATIAATRELSLLLTQEQRTGISPQPGSPHQQRSFSTKTPLPPLTPSLARHLTPTGERDT